MNERNTNPRTTLIREHAGGFAAAGPGFYVWDENPVDVLRIANELPTGCFAATPTTRFLVIASDGAVV
jgi:hypothetical protein